MTGSTGSCRTVPFPPELAAALEAGYLRGVDLWHVAIALYATPRPANLSFATLDARQGAVAEALGFPVLGYPAES